MEITFAWNPDANPRANKRWGVRLFHDARRGCMRSAKTQTGELPPYGYFPCEHCFGYHASKFARAAGKEAFNKVHGG